MKTKYYCIIFIVSLVLIILLLISCSKKADSSEKNVICDYDVIIQTHKFDDMYYHSVVLLNNAGDTICVNNKVLPATLTEEPFFTIDKRDNKFTVTAELGEAHPEGYDYFVFKRDENSISDFVIDTIVFSTRDYSLADEDHMFFERKQCFSNRQLNHVSFCNFKVYENGEHCDLKYLGIKMISFSEADDQFYKLCSQNKVEIVSYFVMNKIIESLAIVPLSSKSLDCYNNIAYYLEQSGHYDESIYLLEKILNDYPDRTVAYLNIGDSYWAKNQIDNSKKSYHKYIHLMELQKKDMKLIPQRVYERMK